MEEYYMKNDKISWMQIVIGTAVAINLMLFSLIVGKKTVSIDEAIPLIAKTAEPRTAVDFDMEKVGETKVPATSDQPSPTGEKGYWTVEHYREYECHYDKNGRLLYKSPTNNNSYLRYWNTAP
jgi:hypothetical protein